MTKVWVLLSMVSNDRRGLLLENGGEGQGLANLADLEGEFSGSEGLSGLFVG